MSSLPKISILMPVYNASSFLKEAIESILNQSFSDFEFLIINDGSIDDSAEIIDSYSDTRIKHYRLPKNSGIVDALNTGLGLAQGEYIARMDADDIAETNRLERQVQFMESNLDVGVAGSWITYFGARKGLIKLPPSHNEILWLLLFGSALFHPSVILRTSVVRDLSIKYPNDSPHAEDYALWIELSKKTKLANIQESLLNYRWTATSVTSVHSVIQKQCAERLRRKMHEMLLGETISEGIWRTISCDANDHLNIANVILVYSRINERHCLFSRLLFEKKIKNRIGILIFKKGTDNASRFWLLKHSFKDFTYLKYFVQSFYK